ncbi:DNA polymerase zeta catalytic subunit isoform X2 [Aristolochia californica]|uniref:DNA polymerase zeta catalytic subunit isoform X2 n=1 Tax=Aristolochia californica TaxID=171875 RepID=UPI0035D8D880
MPIAVPMSSQNDPNVFSMRIVSIDYYTAPPIPDIDICYSSFHGQNVEEVPVIRIYGSTLAGQKTFLHVHRVLPYLYVPCSEISFQNPQEGHEYLLYISRCLDKALQHRSSVGLKRQHVHGCSLVRGKKFYGYHSSEDLFVKIYLYYPLEVSRAAALLLDGAVLNTSVQPYESHIPFLLQFLVDFNLYGMGLLHLSKVKFRHPLPDCFVPRYSRSIDHYRCENESVSCDLPTSKAHSNGKASQDPAIWLFASTPSHWMWPAPVADSQDLGIERQSTCELEGDASVEDILNQQFKMYTSLSQTRDDVKMVQSLVPIWEEEYERTGLDEAVKSPDPNKPHAEVVLRTFCNGLEFEKAFADLCIDAQSLLSSQDKPQEEDDKFMLSLKSISEGGTLPSDEELTKCISSAGESLEFSKEEHKDTCVLSQASPWEDDEGHYDPCRLQPTKDQMLPSERSASTSMSVDRQAIGLLRWLASSQAQDDLCTEDDLVNEAILSPLLPAATIEKVLEKAYLDYEFESQQECQDILDSVDIIDNNVDRITSMHMIPQVDGSSDDQFITPSCKGKSSIIDTEKKALWGSLPFASIQSVQEELESAETTNNSVSRTCARELEAEPSLDDTDVHYSGLCQGNTQSKCSVRDLMRRKRSLQAEPSKNVNSAFEKVVTGTGESCPNCTAQVDSSGCRDIFTRCSSERFGKLPFSSFRGSSHEGTARASADLENFAFIKPTEILEGHKSEGVTVAVCTVLCKCSILEKDAAYRSESVSSGDQSQKLKCFTKAPIILEEGDNDTAGEHSAKTGAFCDASTKIESDKNAQLDMQTQLSWSERLLSPSNNFEEYPTKYIEMTLSRRPPSRESNSAVASLPIPRHDGAVTHEMYLRCSEGREAEDIPLFFESCGTKEDETIPSFGHERVLGCPTHYQNDGSLSYLLTPAVTPPSSDSVHQWLSLEIPRTAPGTHMDPEEVWEESSSPKYDGTLLEKKEALPHSFKRTSSSGFSETSVEYKSAICMKAILDECNQEVNKNSKMAADTCQTNRLATETCSGKALVRELKSTECLQDVSQISGPDTRSKLTPLSQTGFRDPASAGAGQQLTLLSIEVVAESRLNLRPDPRCDAVNIIALAIREDNQPTIEVCVLVRGNNGEQAQRNIDGISDCKMMIFSEEKSLFDHFVNIIGSLDPDIMMGWEVQGGSLGYLAERAAQFGISLLQAISRTPLGEAKVSVSGSANSEAGVLDEPLLVNSVAQEVPIIDDEWGRTHASGLHVSGRIVLNIWRIMRWELKLSMYTLEAVAEAVLRQKVPLIPFGTLTLWFSSGHGRSRYRCIKYIIERAKLNLNIINHLDLVNRTAELARVYGIDFFSVLSRGSQYRVESMYLRLSHTQNYLSISPGRQQVVSQPAMECLPLVMEPESGFYVDPVVVLDFQSLYPSMVIAYNLCFCTCLGKVAPSKAKQLGVSYYLPEPKLLVDLKDQIQLTPNGVMYVSRKVRKGVLPRLLEEILSTRIMVKKAMKKLTPSQQVLQRIFNARQLALKLIANVTYGYTAAGLSGRMPCAELADSIVQCGRRTLETAISFINLHDKWNARVIYGDTDSMFVLLKGRTTEDAFRIGQEIASEITSMNPDPVVLKMDKVYLPCFLLTKKRYVGYSYERENQVKPVFDAKGIETVRRDTCPAVAKLLEKSLKILFETRNIAQVKEYLQNQWTHILCGKVSLQDFVFLKEVRLGTYRASLLPPAALVATKAMREDPRAEPRYGERIPYVVIHGEPGARLSDMVVDPLDLLDINTPYRLNELYYINKQIIPALQRVFRLLGVDLNKWFLEMPRPLKPTLLKHCVSESNLWSDESDSRSGVSRKPRGKRSRIDYYYLSKHCVVCGDLAEASNYLCFKCFKNVPVVATAIVGRTSKLERDIHHLAAICRHCGGGDWIVESGVKCNSLACSVFYERRKVQKELHALSGVAAEAGLYPRCAAELF